jgi:NADH-quinone oxidoreductase subunit M
MVVLIALGVYPKPLLDVITPSVKSSFSQVRSHDPAPPHPAAAPNGGSK